MTTSKHPKGAAGKPRDDSKVNPGIGTSKGAYATGTDPEALEGDHTFEGDVENDTTPQGGVDPNRRARANK